ncbi:MAG: sugar ABC transporter ATP-binding protein [Clostridiales bacterium]|nr:sugar ABC transporter ATP-binding protein [Clostridiales bacterium]MDD7432867.1 sugar ABC transporter ATP-binding protein [Clostridiales bacterium]MDY3061560.1 sugar ABC transporter ATP-binding protein [Eubacteriales bacterium]
MQATLRAVHISKTFPGVQALSDVSLDFYPGEVHALIGENGAGKSTLIKILSGVYTPTEGHIEYCGKVVDFPSPHAAIEAGIAVIHQELSIANDLTVAENIFLGREPKKGRMLDRRKMNQMAQAVLDTMDVDIAATTLCRNLTAAQQQMVEIAKVIQRDAKVVIMDEPTSSLSDREIQSLFTLMKKLKETQVTLVYISHRLAEIFEICERATVLRDGKVITTKRISETSESELVSNMVGRELKDYYNHKRHVRGKEMLRVEGLSRKGEFEDISFSAYAGEILGISGLVGAGRTEVMETIFGARTADKGKIFLYGEEVQINSPQQAIDHKLGMVTEDRRRTGLMLQSSVKNNISLPSLTYNQKKFGFFDALWENKSALQMIKELLIKTPSAETMTANLSGGNQQKVILGKWLVAKSQILILDEPTRGIDVNAKSEFYALMNDFVARGGCIVMVSSELPEIIGVSDRVIVMREGRISGELSSEEATEQNIIHLASITSGSSIPA